MFGKLQVRLWLTLGLISTLTACLSLPTGSETTKAVFQTLGKTLPTASRKDTDQTKKEVAIHRKVFYELCGEFDYCEGPQ